MNRMLGNVLGTATVWGGGALLTWIFHLTDVLGNNGAGWLAAGVIIKSSHSSSGAGTEGVD